MKSLSSEEVDELCYISTEANSSGVRNKANFSGMVLFKFFEQRRLITADNLEYLRSHLKNISRIDLCHLIDEYFNTYLNDSSFVNSDPSPVPHPQSLPTEPHPLPASVGPRPPPIIMITVSRWYSVCTCMDMRVCYMYSLCVILCCWSWTLTCQSVYHA